MMFQRNEKIGTKLYCKYQDSSITFALINLLVAIIKDKSRKLRERIKSIKLLWCVYNN